MMIVILFECPFFSNMVGASLPFLKYVWHVMLIDEFCLQGGIYLDTDAFPVKQLDSLRIHEFTMAFDNIVNPDERAPKRLNNGVIFSTPTAEYLTYWIKEYVNFDPTSWDQHSSIVPYRLATAYPDLIHIEWSRISPISYGFQTAEAGESI